MFTDTAMMDTTALFTKKVPKFFSVKSLM